MGEAFIVRRGGGSGLSVNEAVLRITAETGSTITLAKGGVTVATLASGKGHTNAADSTVADWYYPISASNYGSWTITATNGSNTSSKTVTVNAAKQYDVLLTFDLYFIRNGAPVHTFVTKNGMVCEQSGSGYYMHSNSNDGATGTIQLTSALLNNAQFSSLVMNVNSNTQYVRVGISSDAEVDWSGSGNFVAQQYFTEADNTYRSISVDVSSIVLLDKYLKVWITYWDGGPFGINFKDLYLHK